MAAGAGAGLLVVLLVVGGMVLVCGGVGVALLLPALQYSREAARQMQSTNNMKQIMLAMHQYHDVHKEFPPAVVKDADGQPLYSGLVLLLPYLEQQPLSDRFQKDKAWNSPENMSLSNVTLPMLTDPSNPDNTPGRTDYLLISGPGSALEDTPGMKHGLDKITDGTSNTIVLMEVKGKTSWAAPSTWDLNKPFDGSHPQVVLVGFADGSVKAINRNIDPQTLRRLVERSDGQSLGEY
jgi:type II secretory pathway pseudopilin PulG